MADANQDPTKSPEFEKVVRRFLNTPPTHHDLSPKVKPKGLGDASPKKPARSPKAKGA